MSHLIARTWSFWLIVWILLAFGSYRAMQLWSESARSSPMANLPADSPSERADRQFERAFPHVRSQSSIVVVLTRSEGITLRDRLFVAQDLTPALRRWGEPVRLVRSPGDQYVGQLLLSEDKRAAIVTVDLATDLFDPPTHRVVEETDRLLTQFRTEGKLPLGRRVEVTGNAAVGCELMKAVKQSGRALYWTLGTIVALLLVVNRRPLLAVVPLAALVCAVVVSVGVLTLLARAGYVRLFEGMEVYFTLPVFAMVIISSHLLAARYREELLAKADPQQAIAAALAGVGRIVVVSGIAAIVGGGMLATARFGRYHQAGIGIAVGLLVTLGVVLTFTPSLLRLLGRWAFWPERPNQPIAGRMRWIWKGAAGLVRRRSGTIALASMLLLLPWAVVGIWHYRDLNFALVRELPPDASCRKGIELLKTHFPPGIVAPVILLVDDDKVDFGSDAGIQLVKQLSDRLRATKAMHVADIRSVANPIGTTNVARNAIPGPPEVVAMIQQLIRPQVVAYYVGESEHSRRGLTRLDLLFDRDPMSSEMVDALDGLPQAIRRELPPELRDAKLSLLGDTARLHDFKAVVEHDRRRIQLWGLSAVLVVLVVGLRRITVPVCVVAGIVLNYLVTMGATYLVFRALVGQSFVGISWQVSMLLFLVLIVTGCNNSLLLLPQARQFRRRGPVQALSRAVHSMGGLVAGCGLILAGTLASLSAGAALAGVYQFAFALALGVLLDSLVIRPLLLPAMLVLTHNRRFSRSSRFLGDRVTAALPPTRPTVPARS